MKYLIRRRLEAIIFLVILLSFFIYLSEVMQLKNFMSTLTHTAHDLLLNVVFFVMATMVLAGALGKLMIEFGVVRLLQFLLTPFMRPLFNLPGVAAIAGLMTFMSENTALMSLTDDKNFTAYFNKCQLLSLVNFSTGTGCGLIVVTFMIGNGYYAASLFGFIGAVAGIIFSTRLLQMITKKDFPDEKIKVKVNLEEEIQLHTEGSIFNRVLNSIMDGGKMGVDLGLTIIPGVIIISTLVMILTFDVADATIGYQGLPYEGVALLPRVCSHFGWLFKLMFGFTNPELISFPITTLGSVGAALSIIPKFIKEGLISSNEIAVFTAIGICWSGFLGTHSSILDSLKLRKYVSKALLCHFIGGISAGIFASYMMKLYDIIFS